MIQQCHNLDDNIVYQIPKIAQSIHNMDIMASFLIRITSSVSLNFTQTFIFRFQAFLNQIFTNQLKWHFKIIIIIIIMHRFAWLLHAYIIKIFCWSALLPTTEPLL